MYPGHWPGLHAAFCSEYFGHVHVYPSVFLSAWIQYTTARIVGHNWEKAEEFKINYYLIKINI